MGAAVWTAVLVTAFVSCHALLDLSGVHQINGTWMGSATIPCTYQPSEGFTQQTLSWSVERDYSTSTILRRDDSGDHILLSRFRDRVSVPKHSPGNVSLLIENLEIPDSGHYTCQVVWRSKNNSLITKEVTTTVKVVKVAVTKPVVVAGERGLTVPAGARTSLSCVASGSPPISYRWFRSSPGGKARLLGHQAELAWDSAQPSDSGTYYCEAQSRAGAAQRSDAVRLTVTGSPVPQQPSPGPGGHSRAPLTPQGNVPQSVPTDLPAATLVSGRDAISKGPPVVTGAPRAVLPVSVLAAVLAGAAIGALVAALRRRRRDKAEPLYEVAFHSTADVTGLEADVEAPVKCLHKETNSKTETSNDTFNMKDSVHGSMCTRKDPEYENLVSAMESEYEIERI
ncbi:V-set and immunoglobulin domain-containing protein 4-like isoform X1 [Patagioenas fasciata]|uniref:V-set and immunoglobulin domain-containing protein 4-like isoform X1 n=1 Tax=Patagioenas fasciata TaxID=372321 RepID=UPI0032E85497